MRNMSPITALILLVVLGVIMFCINAWILNDYLLKTEKSDRNVHGLRLPLAIRNENGAIFRRRPELAHVDCTRLLNGERGYAKEIVKLRPILNPNPKLNMSCEAIQNRILPARNPDTSFPILHARIVYMDYEFLEDQLATNYAAKNTYCFFIDKKAPSFFRDQFYLMEKCLPNVIIARRELDTDSAGHNQNEAHLECLRAARNRKWEYAILIQNHDVLIKSHNEITEILKIFGGANDVNVVTCPDDRCLESFEVNLGKLELCPRHLMGKELEACRASSIEWGKGSIQVILSRAAVDFVFDQLNVYQLVKTMNETGYGVDEQLYQSLQITPEVRLPGGFHHKCRDKVQSISRVTQERTLYYGLAKYFMPIPRCPSGMLRHSFCVYGIEDLPGLADSVAVIANKMMPDFDQAVTSCISELLFNRTMDGATVNKHRKFYENINAVRYHRERIKPGFDIDNFEC